MGRLLMRPLGIAGCCFDEKGRRQKIWTEKEKKQYKMENLTEKQKNQILFMRILTKSVKKSCRA